MGKTQENYERRLFWQSHIKQWVDSGLSQVSYCRQNGLRSNRFTYWKCKFKKERGMSELVPVQLPVLSPEPQLNSPSGGSLRLSIDSRFNLFIPDGFTPGTLESVLQIVDKISCGHFRKD